MSFFGMMMGLFAIIFWVLRVAIAFTSSMGIIFFLTPINLTAEIVITFITLICIIFIFKRNIIAALLYLITYCGYFGWNIYTIFQQETIVTTDYFNMLFSVIGILLSLIIFIDVGFSQSSKKTSGKTKKTDWFFQNEQFDRQYDERADKNQYKF